MKILISSKSPLRSHSIVLNFSIGMPKPKGHILKANMLVRKFFVNKRITESSGVVYNFMVHRQRTYFVAIFSLLISNRRFSSAKIEEQMNKKQLVALSKDD